MELFTECISVIEEEEKGYNAKRASTGSREAQATTQKGHQRGEGGMVPVKAFMLRISFLK